MRQKNIQKRHQKPYKFSLKCKRHNLCEYDHQSISRDTSLKAEIERLTASIKVVVEENKTIKAKMAHLKKEVKISLEKVAKEKDTAIKELVEENKTIKTEMANLENDFKTSLEKKVKEQDTSIKEVVRGEKTRKIPILRR